MGRAYGKGPASAQVPATTSNFPTITPSGSLSLRGVRREWTSCTSLNSSRTTTTPTRIFLRTSPSTVLACRREARPVRRLTVKRWPRRASRESGGDRPTWDRLNTSHLHGLQVERLELPDQPGVFGGQAGLQGEPIGRRRRALQREGVLADAVTLPGLVAVQRAVIPHLVEGAGHPACGRAQQLSVPVRLFDLPGLPRPPLKALLVLDHRQETLEPPLSGLGRPAVRRSPRRGFAQPGLERYELRRRVG